jgi:hypothetical protein
MKRLPQKPIAGKEIPRSWFLELWEVIKENQQYKGDGKSIRVNDHVFSAIEKQRVIANGGGGGSHVGQFHIEKEPNSTNIRLYDNSNGKNYDSAPAVAGQIILGSEIIELPKNATHSAGATNYIILVITYNTTSDTFNATVSVGDFVPQSDRYRKIIGSVIYTEATEETAASIKITNLADGLPIEVIGRYARQ